MTGSATPQPEDDDGVAQYRLCSRISNVSSSLDHSDRNGKDYVFNADTDSHTHTWHTLCFPPFLIYVAVQFPINTLSQKTSFLCMCEPTQQRKFGIDTRTELTWLTKYLHWTFRASFTSVIITDFVAFFLFCLFWACCIYLGALESPRCFVAGGAFVAVVV